MVLTERNKAFLKLHTGIFIAGGTGIFGRLITLAELPLVWYRMLIAIVTITIVLASNKRLSLPRNTPMWKIFGLGFLLAIHWVLFYASIKVSNVSIGVVCISLDGFFTAICEPLISKHHIKVKELLLSLFAVTGILLIFGFDSQYRLGIVLGVLQSLIYAIFAILSKKVQAETGEKSSTMLLYQLIGGELLLTCLLPIYLWMFPNLSLIPSDFDLWLLPVFGSLFTITPFLFQLQALRHISAFTVNLSYNLEPLYTIAFAMIIFNEASELNLAFWIGLLLIILSVMLQTYYAAKANK